MTVSLSLKIVEKIFVDITFCSTVSSMLSFIDACTHIARAARCARWKATATVAAIISTTIFGVSTDIAACIYGVRADRCAQRAISPLYVIV